MELWKVGALFVFVTITMAIILKRQRAARRAIPEEIVRLSRVTNAVFGALELQKMLLGQSAGSALPPAASDDWSNGNIQGYSRHIIGQAGQFEKTAITAAVANIYERLFGRSEWKRIGALRDLSGEHEASAREGFLAGQCDARSFLESGGEGGTTGWVRHVKPDLVSSITGAPRK